MARRLTALSLFAAAVLALSAAAQDPPPAKKADPKPPTVLGEVAERLAAKPADAALEAALANDPDVKMARAKIQLAEAEYAKARQAVAHKVLTLRSLIAEQKKAVVTAEQGYVLVEKSRKVGGAGNADVLPFREKLEAAQAALARSETELKLLVGDGPKTAVELFNRVLTAEVLAADLSVSMAQLDAAAVLMSRKVASGPIPDRVRAALDKPVKLGARGEQVGFEKALEVFKKAAGLDVPIRPMPSPLPVIVSEGEELPVGAWFQLFQDTAGARNSGFAFYVREYGLLVANKQTAPPDAPTLTEFWKQKKATAETPKGAEKK
jgi:hypothetical protein